MDSVISSDDEETCYHCEGGYPKPDVYCAGCDDVYHDACFYQEKAHTRRDGTHDKHPITKRDDQAYINEPNHWQAITENEILRDRKQTFIEIDHRTLKLKFGDHAFNLLRPSAMDIPCAPGHDAHADTIQGGSSPIPTPGFISFLGQTGAGKSWIIRGLMKDYPILPSPLPSPGGAANCVMSTSSNINLYVDGATAYTEHPILFMDVEGLDGGDVPLTLSMSNLNPSPVRRTIAQKVFPKIAYTFSNSLVFVTTDSMQASSRIVDTVKAFVNTSSRGSLHQGFRPTLFLVFNKLQDDVSDLSIEHSTSAFKIALSKPTRQEMETYFDPIYVVKVPTPSGSSPLKALGQLETLGALLRKEHLNACAQRLQFSLSFTLEELTVQLARALDVFSAGDESPIFDWTKATMHRFPTDGSQADVHTLPSQSSLTRVSPTQSLSVPLPTSPACATSSWRYAMKAFWTRCWQHYPHAYPRASFAAALRTFSDHFVFCIQLYLCRFPIVGQQVGTLPEDMVQLVCEIQRYIEQFTPCGASREDGATCGGTRQRHNINRHESPSARWVGKFIPAVQVTLLRDIEKNFPAVQEGSQQLTVLQIRNAHFIRNLHCIVTCLGCLFILPTVFLACGHTLCETCVREIACGSVLDVHDLETIKCPFCSCEMAFSPRLLPSLAGYRVLSLDGGGVRGIAQINLLAALEDRCFGIPITYLFDFIIGTSIGGQLALSMTSKESCSTVDELKKEFPDLMEAGIKRRVPVESDMLDAVLLVLFDLTSHRNDLMEKSLKLYFGSERRTLATSSPPGPHVAVTTVSMDDLGTAQLIPNYIHAPTSRSIPRLIGPNPRDCPHVWEAARATAAAFPYFAPYIWQEQKLLDGGFRVNCPAEIGYNEARCLWPERPLDVLVSLGTGLCHKKPTSPARNLALKVGRQVVEAITSSTQLWEAFQARIGKNESRCYRLNPSLAKDVGLTDVKDLIKVAEDTEDWLETQGDELANIGNQLIASLFLCIADGTRDASSWTCNIACRLPHAVEGLAALVDHLIQVAGKRSLFMAKSANYATFHCNPEKALLDWRRAGSRGTILIPLIVSGLPAEEVNVHISMADIFRDQQPNQVYSISGSPYLVGRVLP